MQTKRLSLKEMELRKAKAAALDEALEFLKGRQHCEDCMKVEAILKLASTAGSGDAWGEMK